MHASIIILRIVSTDFDFI